MYIRTKDGVYELKEKGIGQTPTSIQISIITGEYSQADTIEELCDEFIIVLETADGQKIYSINYNLCEALKDKDLIIKVVREKDLKYDFNIYGAIWTDKGLIYVAKMKDKGELELI